MKDYLVLFDIKARELTSTMQDADAIAAKLLEFLPKRSMAHWMVAYNIKGRYLEKK